MDVHGATSYSNAIVLAQVVPRIWLRAPISRMFLNDRPKEGAFGLFRRTVLSTVQCVAVARRREPSSTSWVVTPSRTPFRSHVTHVEDQSSGLFFCSLALSSSSNLYPKDENQIAGLPYKTTS